MTNDATIIYLTIVIWFYNLIFNVTNNVFYCYLYVYSVVSLYFDL